MFKLIENQLEKSNICLFLRYFSYVIIFILAAYLRFSNPNVTILDADSEGYIYPALKYISTGDFDHIYARAYPYPVFILVLLSIFKALNAIVITQHVLGLISGIVLIFFVEKDYKKNKNSLSAKRKVIWSIINVGFVFLSLCNGHIIAFEKMLRPEGIIFPSLIILFITLYKYFSEKKTLKRLGYFFSLSLILLIFLLLHPRFTLGIYLVLPFLLYVEVLKNLKLSFFRVLFTIVGFCLMLLMIVLPEKKMIQKYDLSSKTFGYKQFFFSNAKIISNLTDKGVYVNKEYDSIFLKEKINKALNAENSYQLLGYDIDFLQYGLIDQELVEILIKEYSFKSNINFEDCKTKPLSQSCEKLANEIKQAYHYYYKNWFWIIVKQKPFMVINKMLRQITFVLFNKDYNHFKFENEHQFNQQASWNYLLTEKTLEQNYAYQADKNITIKFPNWLAVSSSYSNFIVRLLFLFALLISIGSLFVKKVDGVEMMVFAIIASYIGLVALTHTFDLTRYIYSISFYILLLIYLVLTRILKYK